MDSVHCPTMHLATMACIVGCTIPVQGVKLLPFHEEMQVVLAVGDVSAMEHDGTALTKIERLPTFDQVAADKIPSVCVSFNEMVEDVCRLTVR